MRSLLFIVFGIIALSCCTDNVKPFECFTVQTVEQCVGKVYDVHCVVTLNDGRTAIVKELVGQGMRVCRYPSSFNYSQGWYLQRQGGRQ